MFGQSTLISYHTEANGYIFFAAGVGELMKTALQKPLEDFESLPWKTLLEKYDKYSLRSWLTAKEGTEMCISSKFLKNMSQSFTPGHSF